MSTRGASPLKNFSRDCPWQWFFLTWGSSTRWCLSYSNSVTKQEPTASMQMVSKDFWWGQIVWNCYIKPKLGAYWKRSPSGRLCFCQPLKRNSGIMKASKRSFFYFQSSIPACIFTFLNNSSSFLRFKSTKTGVNHSRTKIHRIFPYMYMVF